MNPYNHDDFQRDIARIEKSVAFWEIWFWVIALCVPAALILFLVSCAPVTSPAAPPAFLGKWADDSTQAGLLITLEFRADQSAHYIAYSGASIVLQSDGTWRDAPPLVINSFTQCQEGKPLHLFACGAPDTLRAADIAGDSWRIGILDSGTVTTYHFRRIQ